MTAFRFKYVWAYFMVGDLYVLACELISVGKNGKIIKLSQFPEQIISICTTG